MARRWVSLRRRIDRRDPVIWIPLLGAFAQVIYALANPPVWKLSAAFNVYELGLLSYLADFAGYKPSRMPFFDALAAASYALFSPIIGLKALLVFNLLLSIVAIAAFYLAVERLFDRQVAIPASILFGLYPKYVTLTSTGLPEAAAISFLAFALLAFACGRSSGRPIHYGVAGLLVTLSFAMFVPAVAAGVLLAVFIYTASAIERWSERHSWSALVPDRRFVAYSSIPGAFGVTYLIYGPLSSVLADVSANRLSVFIDPEAHSFASKVFWYLAYSFFDFWWHTRGFDRERGIRPLIENLEGFLGPAFPVYIAGWIAITLGLSALVVYGVSVLIRRREPLDLLVAAWIGIYVLAYTYKNLGFVGGFQTRHVSAILPALCIALGLGATRLTGLDRYWPSTDSFRLQAKGLTTALVIVALAVLLVNGLGQGLVENQKRTEAVAEPIEAVTDIVAGESVGAVRGRDFHNLVLYSENRIRPQILTDSREGKTALETRFRNTAEVRLVNDPELRDADVTYLYLRVEPAYVDRIPYTLNMTSERIGRLLDAHETVYHKRIPDGPFRTTSVEIYLLELQ